MRRKTHTRPGLARLALLGTLLLTLLATLAAPQGVSAHSDGAYSHDSSTGTTYPDWMASLPDTTPLNELSIPGTHDSGAAYFGGDAVQTQSMDIATQLNAGIRAFDIRLGNLDVVCPSSNGFYIFHGFVCQFITFQADVLSPMNTFLTAHPGETVLMRIKDESGNGSDFASKVATELSAYSSIMYTGGSSNPTLQAMRGKIVVLQNFGSIGDLASVTTALSWSSLDIQDNFSVTTNWDLDNKWGDIKSQYVDSDVFPGPTDTIYVNFLSASGGSFPYFIASGHSSPGTGDPRLWTGMLWDNVTGSTCGASSDCIAEYPRLNCTGGLINTCSVYFEGTNILSRDYINASVEWRTGIVFADFPGASLIKAVIDVNSNREATTTTVTVPTNPVYTGLPQGATAQTTAGVTVVGTPTVTYTGTAGTTYGPSTTAPSAAGTYNASATFAATIDYYGSTDTEQYTIAKAPLTVTADNQTKIYSAPNPTFTATPVGLVNNETLAGIGITCTSAAVTFSPVGPYDIVCSGTPANYDVTFVKGTLTIIKAATVITNVGATAIYGEPVVALTATLTRTEGTPGPVADGTQVTFTFQGRQTTVGTVNGVATATLPLDQINAGTYRNAVTASFAGDANHLPSTAKGALVLARHVIWVKAIDRTVGFKQPNPTQTPPAGCLAQATATAACWLELANGTGFVYGQSWANLNLTNLRFTYSRNYPNSNASEYVGKTYKISAVGILSTNYDVRYQQGTLTVIQP